MIPMISTTTRISSSVKPPGGLQPRAGELGSLRRLRHEGPCDRDGVVTARTASLVSDVPVADIGIVAVAAGLAIGAERVEVVIPPVSARKRVLVVVAPGVLADPLQI